MISKIRTCGIVGIRGVSVLCECYLGGGLPRFDVVGLPDQSVKESRDRVHAAIRNNGFQFPQRRITVNLAPGEVRKEGPVYDLPIFVGLLCAAGDLPEPPEDACFVGELTLEGELRPANGVLPMAIAAREAGAARIFVPAVNAAEASVAGGLEVYPVHNVSEVVDHLKGIRPITPCEPYVFHSRSGEGLDYSDVRGQEVVKRAMEIAAAGSHHVLLIGPPGAGKSMIAKRLPSILPDLTMDEALESTEIYSVAGLLIGTPMIETRPFRSPHHTVSAPALTGGGSMPRPGEISLAHNGVLFLDEFPEFTRESLEAMRQPLEDGYVTVSRVAGSCRYPSRFMLVCAMNPCRCGYYGEPGNVCNCSDSSIRAYRKRVSGPMLDRLDLHVRVRPVPYEHLHDDQPTESSAAIRARVNAAREIQTERFRDVPDVYCNGQMTPGMVREFCKLEPSAESLLHSVFDRFGLSARSHDRLLRVARTIADLSEQKVIRVEDLNEAVCYRNLDRNSLL